jgi:3-keto-disaccharide hydrolase
MMRATGTVLLALLLHGALAGACTGDSSDAPREGPPAPPAPKADHEITFEGPDAVGAEPGGFTFARTGKGGPGTWEVAESSDAPSGRKVLAQTSSDDTSYRFPLAIYEGFSGRDLDLSVRFKPIAGEVDQAAGLVWRYRDADNYYIVRANALEDNVVLYKVRDGKRTDLDVKGAGRTYGVIAKVPRGTWSELRVIARGGLFTVYLNGSQLFQVEDSTFQGPGRVGLWTKADSVTQFDDLRIAGLDGNGR